MNTLQSHIEEALFSKKGIDPSAVASSVADMRKCKIIKEFSGDDTKRGSIEVEVKNDELYLTTVKDRNWTVFIFELDKLPKDVYPLNIRQISGTAWSFFFTVRSDKITSMDEIFSDKFENNLEIAHGKGRCGINLMILQCYNLTSLKGCPECVDKLTLMFNRQLKNLDGMPKWIDEELVITPINDFKAVNFTNRQGDVSISLVYDIEPKTTKLRDKLISLSLADSEAFESDCIFLKDVYNHLDKRCAVAQTIKKALDEVKR